MQINLFDTWQLRIYISRLEQRTGICSLQHNRDNEHCLLWDFDDAELGSIMMELQILQRKYKLPVIYVFESSKDKYHAYSFTSRTLRETIHILTDTPSIDMHYLRMGIVRGYFTLRISPRKGKDIIFNSEIKSSYPDEMSPYNLTINEYLTSNRGGK